MKSPRPDTWMPIDIGDYLKDTMHLNTEEHGAYLLLIFHAWVNNNSIPDDDDYISNVTKIVTLPTCERTLRTIRKFFKAEDGVLRHKRIAEELEKASNNILKNKERTQKATEARKLKSERNDIPDDPRNDQRNDNRDVNVTTNVTFTPTPTNNNKSKRDNNLNLTTMPCDEPPEIAAPPEVTNSSRDFNDFHFSYDVVCSLLFKKKLTPSDQELLKSWCENHDMREVVTVIDREIQKFQNRGGGKSPNSLAYFKIQVGQACPKIEVDPHRVFGPPPDFSAFDSPEAAAKRRAQV